MKGSRRRHSAEFKARVGLEALKGLRTVNEIAAEYQVHPVQVSPWKKELQDRLPELFRGGPDREKEKLAEDNRQLKMLVGSLSMDVMFLKKSAGIFGSRWTA